MKKTGILLLLTLLFQTSAFAQSRTGNGLSDAEKFAISAGAAQACGVDEDKLINYEVIVSRILVNPTTSEQQETAVLTDYAQKKYQVFTEQKKAPEMNCAEVLQRFDNMAIFKSVVYQDGTVKLPDGKVIKPQRPLSIAQGNEEGEPAYNSPAAVEKEPVMRSEEPAFVEEAPKPAPRKPFRPGVIINKH